LNKDISAEVAREKIIEIYKKKVHGKKPDTSKMSKGHDGKKGHWLEDAMGSKRDANNSPDLLGYEMKTGESKTTFGDWGPDYFIFRDEKKFPNLTGKVGNERRKQSSKNKDEVFLKAFGMWRHADDDKHDYKLNGKIITWKDLGKDGYYSWSGEPSPNKVTDETNEFGQEQVENKVNVHGWFKCLVKNGTFSEIIFGDKITLGLFLEWVRNGDVMFDTRLKERRPDNTDRYGMNWRASSKFWESKSTFRYSGGTA
jgi:hypothetical protein